MASSTAFHIDEAKSLIGKEIGLSDWIRVTQDQVDMFADATLDHDWMHVDVGRSEAESPYGTTIVQGFLMMSLLIHLMHETKLVPGGTSYGLNYGIDRLRFTNVVLVGSRIRARVVLADVKERGPGRYLVTTTNTVEVEGDEKPAVVADWLNLWVKELEAA